MFKAQSRSQLLTAWAFVAAEARAPLVSRTHALTSIPATLVTTVTMVPSMGNSGYVVS